MIFPVTRFGLIFVSALFFFGCANKSLVRYEKLSKASAAQDFQRAIAEVRKDPGLYGSQSKLLYHLDLGILFHYAGLYDSSIVEFETANRLHEDLFTKSVSNEAAAFLTNDNTRPYRGAPHEIVLMHLYQAFNYLALGKTDEALVEARQTQTFLQEQQRKAGNDAKAYVDDGLYRTVAALAYEAAGQRDDALISLYHAIKAYRRDGETPPPSLTRYASRAFAANDRQSDLDALKLAPAEAPGPGEPVFGESAEIILVGSSGKAPKLDQTVIWGTWVRDGVLVIHWQGPNGQVTETLPAPGLPASQVQNAAKGKRTRSGTTFHIKFALPSLKETPSRSRHITFSIPGLGEAKSETYANLDDLLKKYLQESRTSVLTRTVVRVVLRTIASEQTKSELNTSNPWLNLLLNIGTDVLADQLEQADARTWFLLPRTVEIARLAVPPGTYAPTATAEDDRGAQVMTKTFPGITVKPKEKRFLFLPAWQ